jgi:hypothetical protein
MKALIILIAIMLVAPSVYADDADLIVDGKLGIGTGTAALAAQLTINGTADPSGMLTCTNGNTPAAPVSRHTTANLTGTTDVNSAGPYFVAGNVDYLNITGPGNYSRLWPVGYQQLMVNNSATTMSMYGLNSQLINNSAATGEGNLSGGRFYAQHKGTGNIYSIYSTNQTAAIAPLEGATAGANSVYGSYITGSVQATSSASAASTTTLVGTKSCATATARTDGTATATAYNAFGLLSNVSATYSGAHINNAVGVFSQVWAQNATATLDAAYGVYIQNGKAASNTGTILNQYGLYIEDQNLGTDTKYAIYSAGGENHFGGNVSIGTAVQGSNGSAALVFGNGTHPTSLNDAAGLYAKDDGAGTTKLYVFDEDGNENLVTAHTVDAPDWLYDEEDGIPMIVKEVQHFVGYVRYTNQTRQARMAGMTDAEKSRLPLARRTCVFTESFAGHNARLGLTGSKALAKLDWDTQQQAIKARRDAEIAAAGKAKAELQTAIANERDEEARADLISQEAKMKVQTEYVMKTPPARLRAALDAARW